MVIVPICRTDVALKIPTRNWICAFSKHLQPHMGRILVGPKGVLTTLEWKKQQKNLQQVLESSHALGIVSLQLKYSLKFHRHKNLYFAVNVSSNRCLIIIWIAEPIQTLRYFEWGSIAVNSLIGLDSTKQEKSLNLLYSN